MANDRIPSRGEIWFIHLPTDPPGKGPRPVVIVSTDGRNRNPRAQTILVIPLTTSVQKDIPTHIVLAPGETGLQEWSAMKAEDITTVPKRDLIEGKTATRAIGRLKIEEAARKVAIAMGCAPGLT